MDAKATVKVGPFSRGGKSRVEVNAADHDFAPSATVTPVGIFLPEHDERFLYGVTSKVTSDCLVDRLEEWWEVMKERFASITTLIINLDNGPECHSRRTQFLFRMALFAQQTGLSITLAYYPPYHSKYNPVERCWGILETHWNGSLLDSVEAVMETAKTMTWKGKSPVVHLVTTVYETGVKLTKEAMDRLETHVQRLAHLPKWFVHLSFPHPVVLDAF
jgi:hypothetical protein